MSPVKFEATYDPGWTTDRSYLLPRRHDDDVSLWRTHGLAGLRGDHARLHASPRSGHGDALPDALGEVQAPLPDLVQAANLL